MSLIESIPLIVPAVASFPFPIFVGEDCEFITETLLLDGIVASPVLWIESGCTFNNLAPCLDDLSDDTEKIEATWIAHDSSVCPSTFSNTWTGSLANPVGTPGDSDCQAMNLVWRNGSTTPSGDGGCVTNFVELLQGTTVIAKTTEEVDEGSPTTRTYNLTVAEIDAITDHDDLRLKFTCENGLDNAEQKITTVPFGIFFYGGIDYLTA